MLRAGRPSTSQDLRTASSVTDLIPGVLSAIAGAIPDLVSAGGHVIGGLIEGIVGSAGHLISAIKTHVTDALPDAVKTALGIHSPSRVLRELGGFVGKSMALGIADGCPQCPASSRRRPPRRRRLPLRLRPRGVRHDGHRRRSLGHMRAEAGLVADGKVTPWALGRASW